MGDNLKALGKRLRNARVDAGLTQTDVAKHLGVAKQLASHWELARSTISISDLTRFAHLTGQSTDYLLTGIHQPGGNVRIVAPQGRAVPKLNIDQIVAFARGKLALENVEGRHLTASAVGNRAFALQPPDRGIFADNVNVVVTIDPDRQPMPGDICLWMLAGTDVVLARFRPGSGGTKLAPPFQLRFDSDDYPTREVTAKDKPRFLGTKVEHAISSSR